MMPIDRNYWAFKLLLDAIALGLNRRGSAAMQMMLMLTLLLQVLNRHAAKSME